MPLPPPPVLDQTGSYAWLEWFRQLRNYISTVGSVPWSIIDFTSSTLSSIASRSHQLLQALQGGTTGEYYHLTSAQHTDLTDAGSSTLHYHSTDRDSANFTGTNWTDLTDAGATTLHKHDHNSMDSQQGGTTNEYYHLTSSEHVRYKTIEQVVPTTGQSKTIGDTTKYFIIEPAGTLATLTVVMPTNPADGQEVFITSTQIVTALTHNPGAGQTLNGALATVAVNGNAAWVYKLSNTTWYRIS